MPRHMPRDASAYASGCLGICLGTPGHASACRAKPVDKDQRVPSAEAVPERLHRPFPAPFHLRYFECGPGGSGQLPLERAQRASARPLGGAPWGGGVAHKRTEAPRADRKSPKQGAQGAPRGDPMGPQEATRGHQEGPRAPPKVAHTSTYCVPLFGARSKPSSRLLGALLELLGLSGGTPRPSWRGPRGH